MRYKIGEVSKMLGISTDLLRYYEKKGIVTPQKDPNNGYRYYDSWDINFLIDTLWYKNFDFGMTHIAQLVSGCDFDAVQAELTLKSEELRLRIERQQLLLRFLNRHIEEMERGRKILGKCDVLDSRECVCYMYRHNYEYDANADLTRLWMKNLPFGRRCFEIPMSEFHSEHEKGNVSWGLSANPIHAKKYLPELEDTWDYRPPRRCVHTVFKSTGKDRFSPALLNPLIQYANEQGLKLVDNACGILLFSVFEDGGQTGYFEVWIPVEE